MLVRAGRNYNNIEQDWLIPSEGRQPQLLSKPFPGEEENLYAREGILDTTQTKIRERVSDFLTRN